MELQQNEVIFKENVSSAFHDSPKHKVRGIIYAKLTFTNQRIIAKIGGFSKLVGAMKNDFHLNMCDIQEVTKCNLKVLTPVGVRLKMRNGEQYVLQLSKRDEYINWIEQYNK